MKELTVLLQRLHRLKCQNSSPGLLWSFASERDMMQSSLAILSSFSSSRHNLCSSSITNIPHVAPPSCNHTCPLKAQLKVYLPHVLSALLAKNISKVRSPLLLPLWIKLSSPLLGLFVRICNLSASVPVHQGLWSHFMSLLCSEPSINLPSCRV